MSREISNSAPHDPSPLLITGVGTTADSLFLAWRRDGDLQALAQVYDLTSEDLLRVAMHLVRQPATAEDLVQATFLAAIEGAARYDETRSLRSWLLGILHNQAKWRLRSDARAPDAERLPEPEQRGPFDSAVSAEFTERVDAAIAALPEVYRPVLRLSLKHQLSAAEIAHSLGRPAGTVRSQVVRGLELLRAKLPASAQAGALAALLATLMPCRGLAAIRTQVLAQGAAKAATTTAVLSGSIVMKKLVGIAVAAALLLGALMSWDLLAATEAPMPNLEPQIYSEPEAVSAARASDNKRETREQDRPAIVRQGADLAAATTPVWRLSGTVSTEVESAPGAQVQVSLVGYRYREPLTNVTCAADGTFTVDLSTLTRMPQLDLERTKVLALATASGHTHFDSVLDLPHHDPTQPLELWQDFTLEATAVARGRVVDEAGHAVEGALARLLSPTGKELARVPSDRDGRYRLASKNAGAVVVDAMHARLGTASTNYMLESGADTELPNLRLFSTSTTRGRFVFENGEPVPDLPVRVGDRATETNRDGRFALSSLPPGDHKVVLKEDRDWQPRTVTTDAGEQEFVLLGKHLVRMRFEDSGGRELRPFGIKYRVFGREHDASLREFAAGGLLPADVELGDSKRSHTEQVLLSTGSWLWIRATHENAIAETLVHADGSRNVIDATMRLVERAPDALLRVVVTSSDGRPVGAIKATLEQVRLGNPVLEDLTEVEDEEPTYRPGLPAGEQRLYRAPAGVYRLRIDTPRYQKLDQENVFVPFEQTVQLRGGEETVVPVQVQAVGHVRFRFHAEGVEDGARIPGLSVDAACAEGQPRRWRSHFISKRGRGWNTGPAVASEWISWRPRMTAGRHLLTVKAAGYLEERMSVFVNPRETVDVDVWLQPTR